MARTTARGARRTALLITLVALGAPASAVAAPSEQRVRIEGATTTLYEGTLRTDGHAVQATSDTQSRRCDGTNNGAHAEPGPTPTAASDDAMRSVGMAFDGQWYPGFDDYFLQQFGPDREDAATNAYWGILVNGVYTSVGGCQYRLNPGDQTLWVYDAFSMRDLLRLDGPTGIGEPTADVEGGPTTATAQSSFVVGLNAPLVVKAVRNEATGDVGAPGSRAPAVGVRVSPVLTAANGVQTINEADPATATTGADGTATLRWSTPGWKRVKAWGTGVVRSNRLDVCVRNADGSGCGTPPADTTPKDPPPTTVPQPPVTSTGSGSLADAAGQGGATPVRLGATTISALRVTTDGNPAALTGVRWALTGEPLRSWRIEYRDPTATKPRWRTAARGTTQLSALLDLPAGRSADLRAVFQGSGAPTTRAIGRVVVPLDERVRQVRISGARKRLRDPLAWRQTVTRLRRGATVRATLRAGRPIVVARADRRKAVIEVTAAGGRPQRLTVRGHADGRTVLTRARKRSRSGAVTIRVRSGTVLLDGLAVGP
jgi:hypothetical protein